MRFVLGFRFRYVCRNVFVLVSHTRIAGSKRMALSVVRFFFFEVCCLAHNNVDSSVIDLFLSQGFALFCMFNHLRSRSENVPEFLPVVPCRCAFLSAAAPFEVVGCTRIFFSLLVGVLVVGVLYFYQPAFPLVSCVCASFSCFQEGVFRTRR